MILCLLSARDQENWIIKLGRPSRASGSNPSCYKHIYDTVLLINLIQIHFNIGQVFYSYYSLWKTTAESHFTKGFFFFPDFQVKFIHVQSKQFGSCTKTFPGLKTVIFFHLFLPLIYLQTASISSPSVLAQVNKPCSSKVIPHLCWKHHLIQTRNKCVFVTAGLYWHLMVLL